jgi:tetratricopeptide (TPR) repeat protein
MYAHNAFFLHTSCVQRCLIAGQPWACAVSENRDMDAPPPTVFLSYRRDVSSFIARSIFMDLRQHGYDVFMDVESIDSGQFETIILAQIAARAHFLVILTHGTLEECQEPDDWLRREIEYAMALKRNIIPILVNDFHFDDNVRAYLTGGLHDLPRYNGLVLPHDFFDAAMERLRTRFLKLPVQGEITPALPQDTPTVQQKIEEMARQPAPTAQELSAEDSFSRGWAYEKGQDYGQARSWYEKAAAAGHAGAMTHLGWLYEMGQGVTQDYGQAWSWYERGAAAGDEFAKKRLQELSK